MTYAAYAKTKEGEEVEVCDCEADSQAEAEQNLKRFLWAHDMEDADIRLKDRTNEAVPRIVVA